MSGNNLPRIKTDPWQVVPRHVFTAYFHMLISTAFVTVSCIGCLGVNGVNMIMLFLGYPFVAVLVIIS